MGGRNWLNAPRSARRYAAAEGNMSEIGANLIIRAIGGAIGGNADDSFGFCIASPVG
jgi:hypothetical protein